MPPAHSHITEVAGYMLTERLGSGGMGDVYKAYHPALNRTAAVKVLHHKEMADRFKNEAWIQSSVNHPNIVRLYNYTIVAETPCIVMEYIEGDTLDVLLLKKGRLSNEAAEQILLQVAEALAYLHQQGILHRDIKPSNFKIQPDGIVKMLDFGIAKNKYTPKLTQLGFVIGTTEYMAPEQFNNQVELKSDTWSLAVMAYELLTGYLPFEASNPVSLRAKITRAVFTNAKILSPGISEKLNTLIEKNIRVNPAHRLPAKEIVALLGGIQHTPIFVKPNVQAFKGKSTGVFAGIFILAFICITVFFLSRTPVPPIDNDKTDKPAVSEIKMKINVPGIENAIIIFPDGNRQPVPYEVKGKEGETVSFTLHAEGYADKSVLVDFTTRRSSYEYNLEKINQ